MEKREVHTMTFDFTTLKNNLENKGYKVAVFDMGESAFILYSGCYLAIGLLAMLVSALVNRKKLQKYH